MTIKPPFLIYILENYDPLTSTLDTSINIENVISNCLQNQLLITCIMSTVHISSLLLLHPCLFQQQKTQLVHLPIPSDSTENFIQNLLSQMNNFQSSKYINNKKQLTIVVDKGKDALWSIYGAILWPENLLGKVQLLRPNTQGNKMKELIKSVSQIEE